ncbi:MFS transporter [Nocardia sienata]|uniref:MFS transporter n=1 Tax=Nocardia sienata TaxID=248552 RepID=UPI0007A4CF4A|nr:MFS transporter [Nocardia sienata]
MVLLSLLFRTVLNSQSLMLVMHVRHTLDLSYAAAGLLSTVVYLCLAGTELRRGPQLDRLGTRLTIARAILINGICWVIAPFAPFPVLLLLAALAAWFEIPVINVAKQAITVATTERQRRPALAAYEVTADVSLLAGPPLGVAAMSMLDTDVVLLVARMVVLCCGAVLLRSSPSLETETAPVDRPVLRRSWLQPGFVAACVAYAAAAAVISAEEMFVIAVMHDFGDEGAIGLVLAVGAAGAVAGGYLYGSISRTISPYVLLAGLGAGMVPCAFAAGPVMLAIAVFVVGMLAGAVFPACTDYMNAAFSEGAPGEALGFHFSLMWVGIAMGSTVASQGVHLAGSSGGMLFTAALGIGAGILLGRIAARAAAARGRSGAVGRTRIVTAARWILDIAQVVFSRNNDGSLDILLGGNSASGEKENLLVLEHRDRAEVREISSAAPEAAAAGPSGVQTLRTPWSNAPKTKEKQGSPWH